MKNSTKTMEPTAALSVPTTPFQQARAQFDIAADRLGLDSACRDLLRSPMREHHFAVPIRRDDGSSQVFRGVRVQHNNARGIGMAEREDVSMRDAAYLIAVDRTARACVERGWV